MNVRIKAGIDSVIYPLVGAGDDEKVMEEYQSNIFMTSNEWAEFLVKKYILPYLNDRRSEFRQIDIKEIQEVVESGAETSI